MLQDTKPRVGRMKRWCGVSRMGGPLSQPAGRNKVFKNQVIKLKIGTCEVYTYTGRRFYLIELVAVCLQRQEVIIIYFFLNAKCFLNPEDSQLPQQTYSSSSYFILTEKTTRVE